MGLFEGIGVTLRFAVTGLLLGVAATSIPKPLVARLILGYASLNLVFISVLVYSRKHADLIGKNSRNGQLPLWSWIAFWPFHSINRIFAIVAKNHKGVEPATEVFPNFYVGGWYAYELDIHWAGILDLTCELPERCSTDAYMNCPQWDGIVVIQDVDKAAKFLAERAKVGPVLCHCAHGVGRSTTMMRAALVEAGHFDNVDEAFRHIQSKRVVCKTNDSFQAVLEKWQNSR